MSYNLELNKTSPAVFVVVATTFVLDDNSSTIVCAIEEISSPLLSKVIDLLEIITSLSIAALTIACVNCKLPVDFISLTDVYILFGEFPLFNSVVSAIGVFFSIFTTSLVDVTV